MRWFWIDRFIEFESGRRSRAIKNVSLAEDHLHDHFPGYPLMPNSLVIEGLAHTGGLLVCESTGLKQKVVLAKVPRAVFYTEAVPGDTLTYTATIEDISPDGARVHATSHIGDKLHAEMEIVFAYLNEESRRRTLFPPGELVRLLRILKVYEVGRKPDGSPLVEPPSAVGLSQSGGSA